MAAIPAPERQRFLSACANSVRIRIPKEFTHDSNNP
jgi:hypothetical protein